MNPVGHFRTPTPIAQATRSTSIGPRGSYVDDLLAEARKYDYCWAKAYIERAANAARQQNPAFDDRSDPRFRSTRLHIMEKQWAFATNRAREGDVKNAGLLTSDIIELHELCGMGPPNFVPLYRIACDYLFSHLQHLGYGENLFSSMHTIEYAAGAAKVEVPLEIYRIAYIRALDHLPQLVGPKTLEARRDATRRWASAAGVDIEAQIEANYRIGLRRIEEERRAEMYEPPIIETPPPEGLRGLWARIWGRP